VVVTAGGWARHDFALTRRTGRRALPQCEHYYDLFHLIRLSTDALDEIRRDAWNDARRQGQADLAKELRGPRFALWKSPGNLAEASTAA
jgi:transposase